MAKDDVTLKQCAFKTLNSQVSPVAALPLYELLLYTRGAGMKNTVIIIIIIITTITSQLTGGWSTIFCYKVILHM